MEREKLRSNLVPKVIRLAFDHAFSEVEKADAQVQDLKAQLTRFIEITPHIVSSALFLITLIGQWELGKKLYDPEVHRRKQALKKTQKKQLEEEPHD